LWKEKPWFCAFSWFAWESSSSLFFSNSSFHFFFFLLKLIFLCWR
jgi:hypothetical protein